MKPLNDKGLYDLAVSLCNSDNNDGYPNLSESDKKDLKNLLAEITMLTGSIDVRLNEIENHVKHLKRCNDDKNKDLSLYDTTDVVTVATRVASDISAKRKLLLQVLFFINNRPGFGIIY